ncbi:RIP metalloprotease RseP [Glaesserella parasuis]|uniref:RIP metalloprotease RseP n=1 Tax=Glaesserella parasuis TaxID=738 RepID=UPI002437375A|nr:RIP metalloprotease RseP [Glaesserella parasuis]MDG6241994.1 RIP metalloprotease RseP [Glaesserella parasuis]MDO9818895.1 RIP metalloprotease RseP [Glaesserella parasuis]MDO9829483.1 RIP metalloprotease RseP [Glaesserella parasuis]MDP0065242.1 RIP metalloprotease RseP [Glaesserella parasuis]MDP0077764.1 RIP metalloprotease RseP [Glaesserella parasuis]
MTSMLAFFILICVLVFVHEYGHFWAARKCGVKVLRFSIGFGKVLWRKKDKQGTEFAFSLIPLGGYVQMHNGEAEHQLPDSQSLHTKSVLQRTFIVLAGPVANFLFAILAYWAVFNVGVPTVKPVIGSVIPDSIAAYAKLETELEIKTVDNRSVQDWEDVTLALLGKIGEAEVVIEGNHIDENISRQFTLDLRNWNVDGNKENPLTTLGIRPKSATVEPIIKNVVENSVSARSGILAGDKIISVNQQPFEWRDLLEQVQTGNIIDLTIERNNQQLAFQLQPEYSKEDERYLIGLVPTYQPLESKYQSELKYDILSALGKSLEKVVSLSYTILQFIGNLITGELSLSNMGGPISMAKGAGATAEIGFVYYLGFMALISVNLAVMNLFPILPLDGGQLILLAGEAMRKKPISELFQLRFQQIGAMFVIGLMLFALFNDLVHL